MTQYVKEVNFGLYCCYDTLRHGNPEEEMYLFLVKHSSNL
jgi:hypothetical protein